MNIIIPNYEILNFETESLLISELGISKIHSQSLLKALRELKLSKLMTKAEVDEVLAENGLNQSDAFAFLERVIPLKSAEDIYFLRKR